MDEYNSNKEKLYLLNASKDNTWIEGSACGASMGGDIPGNHLLTYLEMSINSAESIDIIVSFLMESGVRLLLPALKSALDRGVKIRLLTGNYLGITQPSALTLLKYELDDRICIHLYREKNRSFHPKAYIFHYADDSEIYVGSSNISRSALTRGIEWNYRFTRKKDEQNYNRFYQEFEDLFCRRSVEVTDEVLEEYARSWKRPALQKDMERDQNNMSEVQTQLMPVFPRDAQIDALYALKKSREQGDQKALIHAATGIGKTYLAAFDSVGFNKVLFVAHREEILKQASESFRRIRPQDEQGFFNKARKDTDRSIIFASVSSLGKDEYLNEKFFPQDYFDYIVVDEFHHAVNDSYMKIISYFKYQFLLGLTATPDRMDGRNIYEICDYNVPFKITLKDAINKGMLVPFRYYGIYDGVDYSGLPVIRGKYLQKDLDIKLIVKERCDLIFKNYKKYGSRRALGFCCSRAHAEKMAEEFCARNIPACAVYSDSDGNFSEDRTAAIEKLEKGEISVIFSVDMFNEGVDIPSLDMVMFLRPTESPVVFLQQLGRGLRKAAGKEYLTVLDFIGNYEKAGNAPFLLSGEPYSREAAEKKEQKDFDFPLDCVVDFDMRLIDLFKEMANRKETRRERIQGEYFRIKELLGGKVPARMDLFTYMDEEIYQLCMKNSNENPFNHYLDFLGDLDQLTDKEWKLFQGPGKEFLHELETTSMSKSYKMPILLAFFNDGQVKMGITEEDVYLNYRSFYERDGNWRDMDRDKGTKGFRNWKRERYLSEARKNPIYYLEGSKSGFFVNKEGFMLALRDDLKDVIDEPAFVDHMKDIIDYRTMNYYRRRYEEGHKLEKEKK